MLQSKLRTLPRIIALPSLAALLLVASCQSNSTTSPEWPPLGSEDAPFNIDPQLLATPGTTNLPTYADPYFSPLMPWQFYQELPYPDLEKGTLLSGVIMYHYPYVTYVTVARHYRGSGTYVYFLPNESLFYLYGDDYMDHHDGMVGPFAGDPRIILPQAGSETPLSP